MNLGITLKSRALKAQQRIALEKTQEKEKREREIIEANLEDVEHFILNVFQPAASEEAERGGTYLLYDARKYPIFTPDFLFTLGIIGEKHGLNIKVGTDRTGNGMMDDVWAVIRISW
jgi:hypothetical protein